MDEYVGCRSPFQLQRERKQSTKKTRYYEEHFEVDYGVLSLLNLAGEARNPFTKFVNGNTYTTIPLLSYYTVDWLPVLNDASMQREAKSNRSNRKANALLQLYLVRSLFRQVLFSQRVQHPFMLLCYTSWWTTFSLRNNISVSCQITHKSRGGKKKRFFVILCTGCQHRNL